MTKISEAKNLGPKTEQWLAHIGINSLEELQEKGLVETFKMLKIAGFNVNLNMMWGMLGAVMDIHWQDIPEEIKDKYKRELKK